MIQLLRPMFGINRLPSGTWAIILARGCAASRLELVNFQFANPIAIQIGLLQLIPLLRSSSFLEKMADFSDGLVFSS